jgi:hypothetical protein
VFVVAVDVLEAEADQAAVDAEFVAVVLAEQPWGPERPLPRPTPPRCVTRTDRAPRPASGTPSGARRHRPAPVTRRRVDPRTRSPPRHADHDRRDEEVMTERQADI